MPISDMPLEQSVKLVGGLRAALGKPTDTDNHVVTANAIAWNFLYIIMLSIGIIGLCGK
jgi:hypothetical protein